MKTKSLQIILLSGLAAALLPLTGRAQSQLVDCNCLAKLQNLQTNACLAPIPDLCALAGPCLLSLTQLQCSQTPPPGGQVGPGTHPITVTFVDSSQNLTQACQVNFVVTPTTGCAFALICASNKTVECGTQWSFNPPTWTNACVPPPGTPSNGVVLTIISTTTNGTCPQVITRTWQGMDDCLYHDQCSQTVTVVDTTPPTLDCNCLTNPAVNPVLVPLTVTACTSSIPDLCPSATFCAADNCGTPTCSQSPPAGTPVGPGTYPITVTVTDCAGNKASCGVSFTVVAPAGGCSTNCLPPPPGMVAWWPLDELCGAFVFADYSGNGNTAIVETGASCSPFSPNAVAGKVAGANYFYSLNVRGRAPSPSLNFGTNSFSADCWVNPVFTGTFQWHPILDKLQQTGTGTGFGYKVGLVNQKVVLVVGSGTLYTNTSLGSVNYGTWNFVAVAVDRVANTVTFRVNGVAEAPVPFTAPGSFNSTVDLLIGGTWAVNIGYGELALDEIELFNRVLTTNDMTALWQADSNGKCKTNHPCPVAVSCPTNMIVHTCGTNAVVTYPSPTLSGPCASNATFIYTPPSGSTFPAGTNTVTCTVLDGNGLPAGSCSFTVTVVANSSGVYDFLPVTIPGAFGKFTSPNGNGFITAQTAGGPFLGLNNTMYPSQFTNLFAASGIVQGYLAQADNGATYSVTFDLSNYALSPATVFGIWNITEEPNLYQIQVFDCTNTLIAPPFPPYFGFLGWDDNALDGNIGWYHMTLNPSSGFLSTSQFKASGIDCDAAFWTNLPPNACKIVVTGRLGPADGVDFYFAEPKPCCEITCPTNITVATCGTGAVVNYPLPTLSGPCVSNATVVCTPPSGSLFPLGTTTVTCTAVGAQGAQAMCSFTVTVTTGALPVITCPSNIIANAYTWCTTNGVTVAYPPPQVSNGTLVSSTPPSGSFFPYGTTVVTCVATNACGTNQCTFTVTVNFGGVIPPCTPPPANMVMWLKFDETSGPTAYNSSAGNNGYLASSPAHNLGQYVVNSLCFNGVNQYVQVTPYPAMQFGTNDFTVDAWVKPATLANTVRVIVDHREENGGVVRGYSLFLGGNNAVGFQIADGTFINYPFTSVVPADGQWHFVAVSVKRNDPLGIKLYVDGLQDPQPRDPTIHPGSVTAGPCYPFRVASRSSSVSALFPGCIDEVELFRRALTAAEIQAIYGAQCKGKCRIACQAGGFNAIPQCWLGHVITNALVIVNPLPYPQTFNWSIQALPVGPGCTKPGPTFSPPSGTVTIPGNNPAVINTAVTLPPGFGVGDCSCWRLTISTPDGSQQATCDGSYCLPRLLSVCTTPTNPLGEAANLQPGTLAFTLEGTGSTDTRLTNPIIVLRSPESVVVSATPLPMITIPPAGGGTVQVPASFAFPDYDPGRIYSVTLEADLDGTGQYTALSSVPVINVLPATPEEGPLTAQRGIGGTIIIIWPDPCGTIVVNPNLGNPTGWTPGPVQTSPWVFTPDLAAPRTFIRLQK